MQHRDVIRIQSSAPPVVEFDTCVSAWYIRFSKGKVVKTLSEDKPGHIVTIDFDAHGKVVGIELIGVKEFSVAAFLRIARVQAPNIDFSKIRFVKTGTPDLVPA